MTRRDPPGVPVRAATADVVLLDDHDTASRIGQRMGTVHSDHSTTDHEILHAVYHLGIVNDVTLYPNSDLLGLHLVCHDETVNHVRRQLPERSNDEISSSKLSGRPPVAHHCDPSHSSGFCSRYPGAGVFDDQALRGGEADPVRRDEKNLKV